MRTLSCTCQKYRFACGAIIQIGLLQNRLTQEGETLGDCLSTRDVSIIRAVCVDEGMMICHVEEIVYFSIICNDTAVDVPGIDVIVGTAGHDTVFHSGLVDSGSLDHQVVHVVVAFRGILEAIGEPFQVWFVLFGDDCTAFHLDNDIVEVPVGTRLPGHEHLAVIGQPEHTWVVIQFVKS